MIKITLKNNTYEINKNTTIEEFLKTSSFKSNLNLYVGATVNNIPQDLTYSLKKDCSIDLIDITSTLGQKIYKNSLSFLFLKAVYDTLNKASVTLSHTISKGQYCEIDGYDYISEDIINKIKNRMNELVDLNLPFSKMILTKEDAIELFNSIKKYDHVELLSTMYKETVNVYTLDGYITYFNDYIVPSTGYLKYFDIVSEDTGVVLLCPTKSNPEKIQDHIKQPKLLKSFEETKRWAKIMNIDTVSDLNKKILNGEHGELIRTVEALQEKKIADIAQNIFDLKKRVVLIAGPSSSGKTTTSKRIETQLKVLGLSPISISLDDYFVNRENTPLDEFGEKDYESIYALDLKKFNEDICNLLKGNEIELPSYNFVTGQREYKGKKIKINSNQPIILEGIHGLNPLLTKEIDDKEKFKIYISPITQLNLDKHNRLSSTDCRLMRRIVRDFNFRGNSAKDTFKMWDSVRRGEDKNIFPYQEEANVIINSTLIYEIPVLKKYIEPLLIAVDTNNPYYVEAKRLLNTLTYFIGINDERDIPSTSIIKEFIGGQPNW